MGLSCPLHMEVVLLMYYRDTVYLRARKSTIVITVVIHYAINSLHLNTVVSTVKPIWSGFYLIQTPIHK